MAKQIVACIDGSSSAQAVCSWAAWVSTQMQTPLTLLHVLYQRTHPIATDLSGSIGIDSRESLLDELAKLDEQRRKLALTEGKQLLEWAKKQAKQLEAKDVSTRQRHGNLVETLGEMEAEIRLLVIGRQGEEAGTSVAQIGSQLESVIRTLKRPILVALPDFKRPQRVMVAYDGSATAQKLVEMAARNPMMQGMLCHIVMVGSDSGNQLDEARRIMAEAGHDVVAARCQGEVDQALWAYAAEQQIDLVVMGAYGHSRIRRFLVGSNTTKMLHSAKLPPLH